MTMSRAGPTVVSTSLSGAMMSFFGSGMVASMLHHGLGLGAEIDLLDLRVMLQRLGRAVEHRAAGLQHVGMVGNLERQRDGLLGKQQRQAVAVQPLEGLVEGGDDRRRQPE